MSLFGIGGGLIGGGIGAFSDNPWQGWSGMGNWLMEGLPGMLGGAALGAGLGLAAESLMSSSDDMPKAPSAEIAAPKAPKTLLDFEDPTKAPEVKEAASKSRKAVARMSGRGSTLLTGPSGLKSDDDKPGLLKKTLGGG